MYVQFLGSGDAFGSGGRFQTCILLAGEQTRALIDCGASSLITMKQRGVDPNGIDAVLLTHLHGDHFGGLPFLLLDAQLVSRREKPLTIAGPPGTAARLEQAAEALFPGSWGIPWRFPLEIVELEPGVAKEVAGLEVTGFEVRHPCGAPPLALRVTCEGKVVTYTGDTEWVDALVPAARAADLFIAEAYFHDRPVKYHLDYQTLARHLDEIGARKVVLTHMSDDMLPRADSLGCAAAEDGKRFEL